MVPTRRFGNTDGGNWKHIQYQGLSVYETAGLRKSPGGM